MNSRVFHPVSGTAAFRSLRKWQGRVGPVSRAAAMVAAMVGLLGCELAGELLRQAFHLPVPGAVVGMFLLAGTLVAVNRKRPPEAMAVPPALRRAADALIGHMGLLFVPAGVGVIAEADLLRQQWLPILAAVLGSTMLGLAVTGLVMSRVTRLVEKRRSAEAPRAVPHASLAGLCRKQARS